MVRNRKRRRSSVGRRTKIALWGATFSVGPAAAIMAAGSSVPVPKDSRLVWWTYNEVSENAAVGRVSDCADIIEGDFRLFHGIRTGLVLTLEDGDLIVWIEKTSERPVSIALEPANETSRGGINEKEQGGWN